MQTIEEYRCAVGNFYSRLVSPTWSKRPKVKKKYTGKKMKERKHIFVILLFLLFSVAVEATANRYFK